MTINDRVSGRNAVPTLLPAHESEQHDARARPAGRPGARVGPAARHETLADRKSTARHHAAETGEPLARDHSGYLYRGLRR